MKYYCFFILIFVFFFNSNGQELNLTLYFEDSLGNQDSLYFGFNKEATRGIDPLLGELNLINDPTDSVFCVFFSDATYYDADNPDYCLQNIRKPTFISKHQYYNTTPIEMGIIAKNWPIKISWNKEDVLMWNLDEFFRTKDLFMLLTGWNPPGGWFDASCGCGVWPKYYTEMSMTNSISLENDAFCKYKADYTRDSICLLFAGVETIGTNAELLTRPEVNFSFNSESKVLTIEKKIMVKKYNIDITDLLGRTIIKRNVSLEHSESVSVLLNDLNPGVYIINISSDENHSICHILKIRIK